MATALVLVEVVSKKKIKRNKRLKEQKMNRIENLTGNSGFVTVAHVDEKWATTIPLAEAILLFDIGCAKIIAPDHIVFFNMRQLKNYVYTRDQHCCAFCGEVGNSVDHIIP